MLYQEALGLSWELRGRAEGIAEAQHSPGHWLLVISLALDWDAKDRSRRSQNRNHFINIERQWKFVP